MASASCPVRELSSPRLVQTASWPVREMSSPLVVQSASWQSASWRIRELSSNPISYYTKYEEVQYDNTVKKTLAFSP